MIKIQNKQPAQTAESAQRFIVFASFNLLAEPKLCFPLLKKMCFFQWPTSCCKTLKRRRRTRFGQSLSMAGFRRSELYPDSNQVDTTRFESQGSNTGLSTEGLHPFRYKKIIDLLASQHLKARSTNDLSSLSIESFLSVAEVRLC